jgi:hypothetical protein
MFLSKIFHDMLTFERKFNKKMEERHKKVICLNAIRNDILPTHAFFSSLISRAIMTTLFKIREINISRMAIRASTNQKPGTPIGT